MNNEPSTNEILKEFDNFEFYISQEQLISDIKIDENDLIKNLENNLENQNIKSYKTPIKKVELEEEEEKTGRNRRYTTRRKPDLKIIKIDESKKKKHEKIEFFGLKKEKLEKEDVMK